MPLQKNPGGKNPQTSRTHGLSLTASLTASLAPSSFTNVTTTFGTKNVPRSPYTNLTIKKKADGLARSAEGSLRSPSASLALPRFPYTNLAIKKKADGLTRSAEGSLRSPSASLAPPRSPSNPTAFCKMICLSQKGYGFQNSNPWKQITSSMRS